MITLTAEIICDKCKQVIASSGPRDLPLSHIIEWTKNKATRHGAKVELTTVTCKDCQPHTQPQTTWIINEQ